MALDGEGGDVRARRMSSTTRTVILGCMGVIASLILVATVVGALRGTNEIARETADRAVPARTALRATRSAAARGQESLLTLVATADPTARAAALNTAQLDGQEKDAAWSDYLKHALGRPGERALQQAYTKAAAASVKDAAALLGTPSTDPRSLRGSPPSGSTPRSSSPRSTVSNRRSTNRMLAHMRRTSSRASSGRAMTCTSRSG